MNNSADERDNCSVQVAVRIRPLVDSEISRGSTNVLEVYQELHQIKIKNTEKAFTFNYVADPETSQDTFYKDRINKMITNLFKGYNMTILAYGQTGSGKTYSMGTNYNGEGEMGIIPRVVNDIFNYVNDNFAYDFSITVSFMELYQEILYDLLSTKSRDQSVIEIREDLKGMLLPGLTEQPVTSAGKTLEFLLKGSQGRATSTTNMNSQSSRSHAIFTINIFMQRKDNNSENRTAKFQLVDLAGSERPKKTGATGVTFKEGVNINKGLLALGNVISALGDEKQQGNYICYRDSNLTRLLKDSLGGNSITLMIACISPADYNVDETLSTLRYADRARKIKNKPIVNEDPKLAEINRLKKQIDQLRLEMIGKGGPIICQGELDQINNENSNLKKKNQDLTMKLSSTINEFIALSERFSIVQTANDVLNKKIIELKESLNLTVGQLNITVEQNDVEGLKDYLPTLTTMKDLLVDIDCNRKKMEEDIRNHERCNSTISNLSNVDLVAESDINEKQESRAAQQMEMMTQLQEISKSLALKEDLAQQILSQNYGIIDANSVKENEMRIKALEDEKDKLLHQLKNSQNQPPNSKVAEQRRKQIKDLEHEIDDLKKKLKQQAQLIKMKENDDQKIRKLNMEIQQMKTNKVTLIKNMKQESEKFRVWKLQREKELYKLKDQDRKRQNEINRMETLHTRQQNVLKRKMEQTLAVNKRLQDVLSLRKNVQESKNTGNKIEKLEAWVQHELDVFVKTVDAEASIPILLEDREMLQRQLDHLKASNKFDETIQEQINLRTLHITEMQQQIINSDQENKSKTRWENVQSMAEAKHCLRHLFDLTADIRKKEASNEFKFSELQNTQKETLQKLEQQANAIKLMKDKHQLNLYETRKEYEDKISILCKQLRGAPIEGHENEITATCLQEMLRKCEEELEEYKQNSSKIEEQLRSENKQLQENLEKIRAALQLQQRLNHTPKQNGKIQSLEVKDSIMDDSQDVILLNSLEDEVVDPKTPELVLNQNTKGGLLKLKGTILDNMKLEFLDNNSSFENDDPNKDPDWKKTPLAKRIVHLRKTSTIASERLTIKRKSNGSCSCKGNCARRTCGCNKLSQSCGSLCNCSPEVCENRLPFKENETEEQEEENAGNSIISFKKPRIDDSTNEKGRRRRFKLE